MSLTFLIGGARSGKSSFAVDIGRRHQADHGARVTFIATAPAVDEDMERRIAQHVAERPPEWFTLEEEVDLAVAIASVTDGMIIVDCLTLWTSNMMARGRTDAQIRADAADAVQAATSRADPVVVISNEVGLGVHPELELVRRYRDVLGWVNQRWAQAADTSLLFVAGRALRLDDPSKLLQDR